MQGQGPGGGGALNSSVYADENYINPFLISLIGGSVRASNFSDDGAAGGGVMLLASAGEIFFMGTSIEVMGWNDTVGEVSTLTDPLTGPQEVSEATCTMVIPTGNTTFMARAYLGP